MPRPDSKIKTYRDFLGQPEAPTGAAPSTDEPTTPVVAENITVSELRKLLDILPKEVWEYHVVNSEYGVIDEANDITCRLDRPIRELRLDEKTKEVLLVSGEGAPVNESEALVHSISVVLSKPMGRDELLGLVRSVLVFGNASSHPKLAAILQDVR